MNALRSFGKLGVYINRHEQNHLKCVLKSSVHMVLLLRVTRDRCLSQHADLRMLSFNYDDNLTFH